VIPAYWIDIEKDDLNEKALNFHELKRSWAKEPEARGLLSTDPKKKTEGPKIILQDPN